VPAAELQAARVDVHDFIEPSVLEAEAWPAYVIDRGGHILHVNGAWDRVAADAAGPLAAEVVGTSWLEHVRGPELVPWYAEVFDRVLEEGAGEAHLGDCNTPTRRRLFFTRFEPLAARGARAPGAVLVATSLIKEGPIEEHYRIAPPDERRYLQPTNLITQCGGCRRVHVAGTLPRVWEFVPEYVARPRDDVSHGLCELCREVHYGQRLRLAC
jgi:hypothetical protein